MKLLRETIRRLLKENDEQMYIDKINSMLDIYNEQESNWRSKEYESDDSTYNTAMTLAAGLGLEEHPDLKIWGAMDGEVGEIWFDGLTQEEAKAITGYNGDEIYTEGELSGHYFLYYYKDDVRHSR